MRRLIFRLSSMGDVILATSALSNDVPADWVVAREFASVLEGHPNIGRLWVFDRGSGFAGWVRLCRELWREGYDEVLDLHVSLRTALARMLFAFWGMSGRGPRWRSLDKQRVRVAGTLLLRKYWPKAWRPGPVIERFSRTAGTQGKARPNLPQMKSATSPAPSGWRGHYLCVMPGAQWAIKRWKIENYADVIERLNLPVAVLGGPADFDSLALAELLKIKGLPYVSGAGTWNLKQVGSALAASKGYLGSDTGLAHMAEALGVPVVVVRGPTGPEAGYGTWQPRSQTVRTGVWCQPCSKYGKRCYRVSSSKKGVCLTALKPQAVLEAVKQMSAE